MAEKRAIYLDTDPKSRYHITRRSFTKLGHVDGSQVRGLVSGTGSGSFSIGFY